MALHDNLYDHRRFSLLQRKIKLEAELKSLIAVVAGEDEDTNNKNNYNKKYQLQKESLEDQITEIDFLLSILPETELNAEPCLRLLMFSTLKTCTSEENIWAQFAAVSSWVSIPVHPSPTVILYDTALRTEFEADENNNKADDKDK